MSTRFCKNANSTAWLSQKPIVLPESQRLVVISGLTTEAARAGSELGGQCTLGQWLDESPLLCNLRGLRQTTIEGYRRVLDLHVSSSLRESALGEILPRQLNALY